MSDYEDRIGELNPMESHIYTWAMSALFSSIPQPSEIKSDDYLPLPRSLGRCPECGGMLEFHFLDAKTGSAKISVGFRCLDMDLRQHFYRPELWLENNRGIGEIVQRLYFLKWHGLSFDRPPNEDEQKYVAWVLEDYETRSGEGGPGEASNSASEGDSATEVGN